MDAQRAIELALGTLASLALIGGIVASEIPSTGVAFDMEALALLSGLVMLYFGYRASDVSPGRGLPFVGPFGKERERLDKRRERGRDRSDERNAPRESYRRGGEPPQ